MYTDSEKDAIKTLTKVYVSKMSRILDAFKRLRRMNCKHCWI